tara:strand:+ start:1418 stop:2464 length:1047 start_codon:yes stop_codon:yes gene_type:complete
MKLFKQIIIILVVFFKTETLFSQNNLFDVDNIKIEKNNNITNDALANNAIKKGFNQLTKKILLKDDSKKLLDLNFSSIKQLVTYYQITSISKEKDNKEILNFNIRFDKNKIHDLFYKKGISYSEILKKELYILPIIVRNNEIYIFNSNFYYKNWNIVYENDLIEFILPLENIEIIKYINDYKTNLINLDVVKLFTGYSNKNLAFVLIDDNKNDVKKIYIKSVIEKKKISKNLFFDKQNKLINNFDENVIIEIKKELINLIKSENLIDIRTPFFLNAKFNLSKKSNLVRLNSIIEKIDSIENIYVQEFNKDYMNLRIKYLGKLEKIISQLKKENIDLQLVNDQWIIKTL